MSIDEVAGRSLTALTDCLRSMPDPYGRVMRRYRRGQRRRRAALGAGVMTTSVIMAVALLPSAERAPQPVAEDNSGWKNHLMWNQRLVDSPTRGAAGQDAAFVKEFGDQVLEHMRAGRYSRQWPVRQAKVVFLDDVGPKRVALVAFVLTAPDPATQWPHSSAWFFADRGASAAELAHPARNNGIGDGLNPVETEVISEVAGGPMYLVSVAPARCHFETAPLPDANVWTREPTGSYLVRLPETERAEWWRVVCDGVVRKEEAAPGGLYRDHLTTAEVTAALANARGQVDRDHAAMYLSGVMEGYATLGKPSVLWGGQITGTEPEDSLSFDGTAMVAVVRAARGGWIGKLSIANEPGHTGGSTGTGFVFGTRSDPRTPNILLAIRLGERTGNVLVLPPAGAASVRVLDGQGAMVAQAPVRDDAALVKVANPGELRYEALDTAGNVIGEGVIADQAQLGQIDRFSEP